MTKRYGELVATARDVLRDANGDGWKLAKVTFDGVTFLRNQKRITQGAALEEWSRDVAMERFSKTSARRYFDVWRKFGKARERDPKTGKPLSFAEHYAIARGGQNAKKAMDDARERGAGVQAAAQKLVVLDGMAVTGALARVADVSAALAKLAEHQAEGHRLTPEELKKLAELERRMKRNLGIVKKMSTD